MSRSRGSRSRRTDAPLDLAVTSSPSLEAPHTQEPRMLKIYGVPLSVHTRKVIVVALTKGLEYENLPVVPVVPGNPPPNWRELSPTGKIPAITDGDFTLADWAAIGVYPDRQYPRVPVYPRDTRPFAEALALEQFAGNLFREVVHPLFHESIVHPRIRNVPTDQKRIDDVQPHHLPLPGLRPVRRPLPAPRRAFRAHAATAGGSRGLAPRTSGSGLHATRPELACSGSGTSRASPRVRAGCRGSMTGSAGA